MEPVPAGKKDSPPEDGWFGRLFTQAASSTQKVKRDDLALNQWDRRKTSGGRQTTHKINSRARVGTGPASMKKGCFMAMILGPYTMSFEGQSKEQFARPEWDGKFKDRWVRAHA